MVLNTTFNNISAISWRSVFLVEEKGGLGENHWPVASHWQTLSHNVVHLSLGGIRTHQWWYVPIAYAVVNPTIIQSQPRGSYTWKRVEVLIMSFDTQKASLKRQLLLHCNLTTRKFHTPCYFVYLFYGSGSNVVIPNVIPA